MTVAADSAQMALAAILGESQVVSEPAACAAWAVGGKVPKYGVEPPTAECVAAVLKIAADHDLAVIPRGNGTQLDLGSPPSRYDLSVSLRKLNRVRHFEPADLTIGVEAGMKLGELQDFLGREGLWLPLDPRGGATATIGGILATNSTGPLRLRFGSARDMLLGIKVATTEGKLIKSGGRVVKNVAGYDLSKLFVGSFGTLGLIVEASFKLFPRPASRATWVLEPGTLGRARDLRGRILNSPLEPLRMVLLDSGAAGLFRQGMHSGGEPELWIEAGGSPKILERHAKDLAEIGRSMGIACRTMDELAEQQLWDQLINFERSLPALHSEVMIMKAALPIACSEQFLSLARQAAEGDGISIAGIAQPGVGIVHLGVWGVKLGEIAAPLVTNARKSAESLGGALVVEQYPAGFEGERDVWGAPGDLLPSMRGLKAVWDPRGILSPGRFVGGI
ncbi:MAG: FAD-binding oxidoreductase [Terriglobia bacterium]